MTILQGSPEWHALRIGKVTASRISDMLAKTKTGWGASRANYAAELVAERLTGLRTEGYISDAMRFGTENEPLARAAYEFHTDATVVPAAFVDHPCIPMSGASPDGLIGDDGLIEIKVPNVATHINTLLGGSIPGAYRLQMMWQMTCTNRQYCDFVSFNPLLPEEMRLFVRRCERDEALCGEIEREVELFLAEIDDTIKRLRRTYAEAA